MLERRENRQKLQHAAGVDVRYTPQLDKYNLAIVF